MRDEPKRRPSMADETSHSDFSGQSGHATFDRKSAAWVLPCRSRKASVAAKHRGTQSRAARIAQCRWQGPRGDLSSFRICPRRINSGIVGVDGALAQKVNPNQLRLTSLGSGAAHIMRRSPTTAEM